MLFLQFFNLALARQVVGRGRLGDEILTESASCGDIKVANSAFGLVVLFYMPCLTFLDSWGPGIIVCDLVNFGSDRL